MHPAEPPSIPAHILEILSQEGNLPICVACGTQYPGPKDTCMICEDPRQAVPASGQSWTSLSELSAEGRRNTIVKDKDDERVGFIGVEPAFGINQHPILIETAAGSYIWDCAAYISTALVHHLSNLSKPLKGIAISHPHFFSTSLTWSRLLDVPLYLCTADKEWYPRIADIREGEVIWWQGDYPLGPNLRLIQCGGHFSGSAVLLWDRLNEPPTTGKRAPVSGLLLTADTIMVQPTQRGFTFIWSVPNMIPLGPQDVLSIQTKLSSLPFSQATSSWPNRFIRENAREVMVQSVRAHLRAMGWGVGKGGELLPFDQTVDHDVGGGESEGKVDQGVEDEDEGENSGSGAGGMRLMLSSLGGR